MVYLKMSKDLEAASFINDQPSHSLSPIFNNLQPLEAVDRVSETQLQMGGNLN